MAINIDKSLFVKCIQSLQDVNDFQRGVLDLVRKTDPYADLGIMAYPDCTYTLLSLLEEVTGDIHGWIAYFCYERDFGRNTELGDVTDAEGNPIPFSTADDLWNMLN